MRIEIDTSGGMFAIDVGHRPGTVMLELGLGINALNLSGVTPDDARKLADALNQTADRAEANDDRHMREFTDHQLRWYLACCYLEDRQELMLRLIGGEVPDLSDLTRSELIEEAVNQNESARDCARRLRQCLAGEVPGWPPYADGGGR
jgi:hypothetical protein